MNNKSKMAEVNGINRGRMITAAKKACKWLASGALVSFSLLGTAAYAGSGAWTVSNTSTNFANSVLGADSAGNVYSTYQYGLYKTSNGGASWSSIYVNGLSYPVAMVVSPAGTIYVASSGSLFRSTNAGGSWSARLTTPGSTCASVNGSGSAYVTSNITTLALDRNGTVYVGTDYCGVYKSINGGASWTWISSTLANGHGNVQRLATDANGNVFAQVLNFGLMKSAGGGSTWTSVGGYNLRGDYPMAGDSAGYMYVAAQGGVGGVHKSLGGTSWQAIGPSSTASAFTVDFNGYLYATNVAGVHQSKNGGATWTVIGWGNVLSPPARAITVSPGLKPTIYVTTPNGIYQYTLLN